MNVSPASPPKSPKKPAAKKGKAAGPEQHVCDFCKKGFVRESTFLVHLCEPKRRWMDRDTKHVKLGFVVFQRFHEANYIGRKAKTFEEFMRSPLYVGFTKFGKYILTIDAINPKAFIEFIIKSNIPLKRWESSVVYETYVRELNKKETASAAVERHFLLMQQWSMNTGEPMQDFFRKVSPAQATLWIGSGRISPWVLFNCESAEELIQRLSEEQFKLVFSYIDPDFWAIRFKRAQHDADVVREELKAFGM